MYFQILSIFSEFESAHIEAHGDIWGNVIGALIEIIGVVITLIITYKIAKKQISSSSKSTKNKIINSNKNVEKKIVQYRKDSYNNSLYVYNHKRIDNIIIYIMKTLSITLNVHDYIFQVLDFEHRGINYNDSFLLHLQKKIRKDLKRLDDVSHVNYYMLSWGIISDSMQSLIRSVGLSTDFPYKKVSDLMLKLVKTKQQLHDRLDFVVIDTLESEKYKIAINSKHLKKINLIIDHIHDICERILVPINNDSNFNPYSGHRDDDIKFMAHKLMQLLKKSNN